MQEIKSIPYLRDLSPLEIKILQYVIQPEGLSSVTAEDVINHFAKANEEISMEASLAVAYLTENLYVSRDPRTMALTTNCYQAA